MIITLLRKPLDGNVAENTLKHGCGSINIDATRVGTETMVSTAMSSLGVMHDDDWKSKPIEAKESNGRWPANFILTHKGGCELKGTKKIKEGKKRSDLGGTDREVGLYKDGLKKRAKDQHQGEETMEDWDCVKGCPVKELDQQSGIRLSGKSNGNAPVGGSGVITPLRRGALIPRNDSGGAPRFFKQFKKGNDQ